MLEHLHGHSHHSNVLGPDALSTPEQLVKRAGELGMPSICLTDHANVSGIPSFYEACQKHGLKPNVGVELYVCRESELMLRPEKGDKTKVYCHLLALVRNWDGLIELFDLLTSANSDRQFYRRPRVTLEQLYGTKHLVFTTACMGGLLARGDWRECVEELVAHVGKERVWLEVQAHNHHEQHLINRRAVQLSEEFGLGLVAGQDFHYAEHGGHVAHECMINIGRTTISDPNRRTYNTDQLFITSTGEMVESFLHGQVAPGVLTEKQVAQAIFNTGVVSSQLDFKWQGMQTSLPMMSTRPERRLMHLCLQGLKAKSLDSDMRYLERLQYEYDVLLKSGFLSYFLVLHDIVTWARSRNIMIGPGRGSAAGSLVSYLLGITSVDPIRHNMMFERFYRPGRMDLPDIDTDFQDDRRDEVIDYIVGRFGWEQVAKIATFSTLKPKGAIKDVGRVFELPASVVNAATVQIDDAHMTPEEVFAQPSIKALFAQYPGIEPYARAMIGVIRGTGEHASGIVVAGEPIRKRAALLRPKKVGGMPAVCWDMRQAERMGMMKLDILGLRTLQVIQRANDNIQALHGKRIDFEFLELEDAKVLELFNAGDTVSVFQFESQGIRRALKEVCVNRFEDIVVVNALYRPGPMELIPVYSAGKRDPVHVHYIHDSLRSHLESTYGVMVYQEQTMSIAREVAGFSWEMTDKLRKAVGKKLPAEMAKLQQEFVDGCITTSGLERQQAEIIWGQIEKFAGYGFNRSHAVCYSVIAYWTAWLKVYYPTEFYAAVLSSTGDDETVRAAVNDATRRGIVISSPDVNKSAATLYVPIGAKTIKSPLTAIKGIGERAAEIIVETRNGLMDSQGLRFGETREEGVKNVKLASYNPSMARNGDYTSAADFASRVYARVVNKRVVSQLEACGAIPGVAANVEQAHELLAATVQIKIEVPQAIDTNTLSALNAKIGQWLAPIEQHVGKNRVMPLIGGHPRLMIVFDKPERDDERKGEIGNGPGFELLRKILLDKVGLKRPDLYVTSFYRFFNPPRGYDSLDEHSEQLLKLELSIVKPTIVLACGTRVVKFFTGKGAGQMHGQMVNYGTTPVVCMMSPVAAIMSSDKTPQIESCVVDNLAGLF